MISHATTLAGVFLLKPRIYGDDRGYFLETWNKRAFRELGIDTDFVQDNHSLSQAGILRGLHYQLPNPQGKLVWAIEGEVHDVVVDLRQSSPTFAKWEAFRLTADNHSRIWVPPGCAHGFYVLSDRAQFIYKCTSYYSPKDEHTLAWNDPTLAINWPLFAGTSPSLSPKDQNGLPLSSCPLFP